MPETPRRITRMSLPDGTESPPVEDGLGQAADLFATDTDNPWADALNMFTAPEEAQQDFEPEAVEPPVEAMEPAVLERARASFRPAGTPNPAEPAPIPQVMPEAPVTARSDVRRELSQGVAFGPGGTTFPVELDVAGASKPRATGGGAMAKVRQKVSMAPDVDMPSTRPLEMAMAHQAAQQAYYQGVEADIQTVAAQMLQEEQVRFQENIAAKQAAIDAKFAELQSFNEELRNREVVPGLVFGSTAEAALFSGIAALAAVMDDQTSLDMINKAIDRSIDAQKANIAHGREMGQQGMQLYRQLRAQLGDEQSASQAYRAAMLSVAERQIASNAARAGWADALGRTGVLLEQLRYEAAQQSALANQQANKREFDAEFKIHQRNLNDLMGASQQAIQGAQYDAAAMQHARRPAGRQRAAAQQPQQQDRQFSRESYTAEQLNAYADQIGRPINAIPSRTEPGKFHVWHGEAGTPSVAAAGKVAERRPEAERQAYRGPIRVRPPTSAAQEHTWQELAPAERTAIRSTTKAIRKIQRAIQEYRSLPAGTLADISRKIPGTDENLDAGRIWGQNLGSAQQEINSGVLNTSGEVEVLNKLNPDAVGFNLVTRDDAIRILEGLLRNQVRALKEEAEDLGFEVEGTLAGMR